MLKMICSKCKDEFKISGADFEDHQECGSFDLCPGCKKLCKEAIVVEDSDSIEDVQQESHELPETKYFLE